MLTITSKDNPLIKSIIKLRDANKRKKQNLIVVEGEREINYAVEGGFEIVNLVCTEKPSKDEYGLRGKINNSVTDIVSDEIFKKISLREHPDGYLALARPKELKLSEIKLSDNPIVIILEQTEKPGNLGAILRTADAAGADAVILCDPRIDIYNPNAIRSSQGTVFTNQIAISTNEETLDWLSKNKIKSYGAALSAERFYTSADFKIPTALVFGAEDRGMTDFWMKNCDELIKIPMKGKIDSLNLSVSAGVIVYEAVRQKSEL